MQIKKQNNLLPGILCALWALLLAFVGAFWLLGPDRYATGSVLLFLPAWLWALPGVLVLPVCLWYGPVRIRLCAICLSILALGPISGFRLGLPIGPGKDYGQSIRVMTYNVKYNRGGMGAILRNIKTANPDILFLQDAGGAILGPIGEMLKGYDARGYDQYAIFSRYPLSELEAVPIPLPFRINECCIKCKLTFKGRKITLYNVHLITPREGINAVRADGVDGLDYIEDNALARLQQTQALQSSISKEITPVLLAGDLNSPPASLVNRMLRGCGLRDAFESAGRGWGFTYGHSHRPGLPGIRIDHIYASPALKFIRCETGSSKGSEHCPVSSQLIMDNG